MRSTQKMVSAQAQLIQVRYAISLGVCQRRVCALMEVSRFDLYYTQRMPVKDVTCDSGNATFVRVIPTVLVRVVSASS